MYNMDHSNLLDSDNDVLNIIGDYVKKDNHDRMEKAKKKNIIDEKMKNLKNGYLNMLMKSKRIKKRL